MSKFHVSLCLFLLILYTTEQQKILFDSSIQVIQNETFHLADPPSFARVIHRNFQSSNSKLKCNSIEAQIELKSISEFTLNSFNSLQDKYNHKNQQIISATYNWQNQTWILISDGSILHLQINALTNQFNLLKKYLPDKDIQNFGKFYGEIYSLRNKIFVRYLNELNSITFRDNYWQIEYHFTNQPPIRVKATKNQLYFITHQNLYCIQSDISFKRLSAIESSYFIDFDVKDEMIVALTSKGLVEIGVYNFDYIGVEMLQNMQYAKKIRIGFNYVLVYIKDKNQQIIQQYYLQNFRSILNQRRNLGLKGRYVRQGKKQTQFKRVQNLLVNGKYAIIQEKHQFSLFQININTNESIPALKNHKKFKFDSIIVLQWQNQTLFLVESNSLKLLPLTNHFFHDDLFKGTLSCIAQKMQHVQLKVMHKGICKDQPFQASQWQCEKQTTYSINIEADNFFHIFSKLQLYFLALLILLIVFFIVMYIQLGKAIRQSKEGQGKLKNRNKIKDQNFYKESESKMEEYK